MKLFLFSQVVSAVNCARRGWVNVEMDIIACEACGARVLFSTPSSWSQQQGMLLIYFTISRTIKPSCNWCSNFLLCS